MKLIVSAHGMLAKEVVNSAGMVFGAIDDLDIVTFVPGENAETLKAKYKELIDGYKEDEEILFLVDLFGGSPYNAAFETVIGQDRMDVITGLSTSNADQGCRNQNNGRRYQGKRSLMTNFQEIM